MWNWFYDIHHYIIFLASRGWPAFDVARGYRDARGRDACQDRDGALTGKRGYGHQFLA